MVKISTAGLSKADSDDHDADIATVKGCIYQGSS